LEPQDCLPADYSGALHFPVLEPFRFCSFEAQAGIALILPGQQHSADFQPEYRNDEMVVRVLD
jgi:hypothetical protein